MLAYHVGSADIELAVRLASELYDGNVVLEYKPRAYGNGVRFKLTVRSSYGEGARRSHRGRRIKAACWHVHRDVLAELFELAPTADVRTAVARYYGRPEFLEKFEATGDHNIGSMMLSCSFRDACECTERGGGRRGSGRADARPSRPIVGA